MRRRSDSNKGINDATIDISDLELDPHDEDAIEDPYEKPYSTSPTGLGIYTGRSTNTTSSPDDPLAPTRSSLLQQGTFLVKVTKKKRKNMLFRLDFESAKVCWNPARPSKQFYIDDIKEIRSGSEAKHYREELQISELEERRWFTIIYSNPDRSKGRSIKTMHLIAPNDHTFELWTRALEEVSRSRIEMMTGLAGAGEKSLKQLWRREMHKRFNGGEHAEVDEKIDLAGVIKICRNLDINCSENAIRAQFDKADADHTGYLPFNQFQNFIRRLKERKDIRQIFKALLAPGDAELDRECFFNFLIDVQGVNVSADIPRWTSIFERYARSSKPKASTWPAATDAAVPRMNLQAFQNYLLSPANQPLKGVASDEIPQRPLDRPLNEYFISSSHNTYLLGRQVAGQSSVEAYITALQNGCRCIEIDCWDGPDGRPIVMHGRTMTSSVQFSDCIAVIAKYAFVRSAYPLIISLEVHCSPEQQVLMTDIMKKHFGDQLILEPLNPESSQLPSPEDLKGKILIKVKSAEEFDDISVQSELPSTRRQRGIGSPFSKPVDIKNHSYTSGVPLSSTPSMSPPERIGSFWNTPRGSITSTSNTPLSPASSAEESDVPQAAVKRKKKTSNIVMPLGALGVYTRGISGKCADFRSPEANSYNHVFSFQERAFENACKDPATKAEIELHNMYFLMRVYPSGYRINSSNFDPLKFWRRGVQMAALNWQTYDLAMQINDAMFAAGLDRTGYVLKPRDMRTSSRSSELVVERPKKKVKKRVKFSVEIISAQQLPRPRGLPLDAPLNPYVEVEMFHAEDKAPGIACGEGGMDASDRAGLSGIGSPHRRRTKIIQGNGYDPIFNESLTMSCETKYPSLVFIRWSVWNSVDGRNLGNAPLGRFTAKLSSLEQGYRHLPLVDANGDEYLCCSLFCKIKKDPYLSLNENMLSSSISSALSVPTSPSLAPTRNWVKRAFSRTPSERKRKTEPKEIASDTGSFSRTTSYEKSAPSF